MRPPTVPRPVLLRTCPTLTTPVGFGAAVRSAGPAHHRIDDVDPEAWGGAHDEPVGVPKQCDEVVVNYPTAIQPIVAVVIIVMVLVAVGAVASEAVSETILFARSVFASFAMGILVALLILRVVA